MNRNESRRQNKTSDARGIEQEKTDKKERVETISHPRRTHTHSGTNKVLVNKATTVRGNKKKRFVPNLCFKSPKNNQKKIRLAQDYFLFC